MKNLLIDISHYIKGTRFAPARQTTMARMLWLYALLIAFIFIENKSFSSSNNDGTIVYTTLYMITVLPVIGVHLVFHSIKYKPTLATLLPVNYKRRIVADIIYPLIMSIVVQLMITVFFLLFALIALLVNPEVYEEDTLLLGMGWLAIFFRFLFAYGCNIIIACQKQTKPKVIASVVFTAVYFAATVLTGYAINGFNLEAGSNAVYVSQFNNMAMPWLGYMLWAIAGIGTMIAAVFCVIKFEKPKEF